MCLGFMPELGLVETCSCLQANFKFFFDSILIFENSITLFILVSLSFCLQPFCSINGNIWASFFPWEFILAAVFSQNWIRSFGLRFYSQTFALQVHTHKWMLIDCVQLWRGLIYLSQFSVIFSCEIKLLRTSFIVIIVQLTHPLLL